MVSSGELEGSEGSSRRQVEEVLQHKEKEEAEDGLLRPKILRGRIKLGIKYRHPNMLHSSCPSFNASASNNRRAGLIHTKLRLLSGKVVEKPLDCLRAVTNPGPAQVDSLKQTLFFVTSDRLGGDT